MTKRTTVSLPEIVYEAARRQMHLYGYNEFSDYVQGLIRADTKFGPGGNIAMREHPAPCGLVTPEKKPLTAAQKDNDRIALEKIKALAKKPRKTGTTP